MRALLTQGLSEYLGQLGEECGLGKRLLDEVESWFQHALGAEQAMGISGHEQDPDARLERTDPVGNLASQDVRHDDVGQQHVDGALLAGRMSRASSPLAAVSTR